MRYLACLVLLAAFVPAQRAAADNCIGGRRAIDRHPELKLQCLARRYKDANNTEKPGLLPVPMQPSADAYVTDCPVPLKDLAEPSACPRVMLLSGKTLSVTEKARGHYYVSIWDETTTLLNDVEATVVDPAAVKYLTVKHDNKTYYVFLADVDPATKKHEKYYRVDVFDDNAVLSNPDCGKEAPAIALKPAAGVECGGTIPPTRKYTRNFESETGGGYEPPR